MFKNPETGLANPYPQPCVSNVDIDKPADTTNEYDLGISTTIDISGKVSISLAVVSLNATGESKSVTGNTLAATFVPGGLQELLTAVDKTTKSCADGKKASLACKINTADLHRSLRDHYMIQETSSGTELFDRLRSLAK